MAASNRSGFFSPVLRLAVQNQTVFKSTRRKKSGGGFNPPPLFAY
jgi:hypothetical protein